MKYPAIWLMGEGAHGEVLSIAFAGDGQHQDAGGKCVHVAPNTSSVITSKSISKNGGRARHPGVLAGANGASRPRAKGGLGPLIPDAARRARPGPYTPIGEQKTGGRQEAARAEN